jgi:hypothetical protein
MEFDGRARMALETQRRIELGRMPMDSPQQAHGHICSARPTVFGDCPVLVTSQDRMRRQFGQRLSLPLLEAPVVGLLVEFAGPGP